MRCLTKISIYDKVELRLFMKGFTMFNNTSSAGQGFFLVEGIDASKIVLLAINASNGGVICPCCGSDQSVFVRHDNDYINHCVRCKAFFDEETSDCSICGDIIPASVWAWADICPFCLGVPEIADRTVNDER